MRTTTRPCTAASIERSSEMTGRYEARARRRSNADRRPPNELVFTRGATEAINLVARTLPKNGRNRVLALAARASQQHRAVAARRLRSRRGAAHARRPDRPRRRRSRCSRKSIASSLSRMSPTCSARFSTRSARRRLRIRKARCSCSTAARRYRACAVNIGTIGADFYAFSGAQALRADRHRLPVGTRRAAAATAAVAGRRRDDRQGHI